MNGTGRKSTDRTEQTGQSRQDSADRTAQAENKQARTNRIRKTGLENLIILSTNCSAERFPPVKYKSFYIIDISTGTAHAYFKVRAI